MFERLEQEFKIRRYSKKTAKSYLHYNQKFLLFCKKNVDKVTVDDFRNYLEYLANKNVSASTMRLAFNSLQFFYKTILKTKLMEDIIIPKNDYKIIVGLTKDEVNNLISVIKNPKHRLLLELIYCSGLRANEAVNVKVKDILVKEKIVVVQSGKGRKGRKSIISDKFIDHFNNLNEESSYLFSGRNGHLTTRSVQQIIKQAAKKANINKKVYPHLIRHAFATHLFDNDTKTEYIQRLLGHKDKKTTDRYIGVHQKNVVNVKSPHDLL
jgi:integrase/recombinase XerD